MDQLDGQHAWRGLCHSAGSEGFDVLMRFNESIRVRLWGRALHSFRAGEVYNVSMAVAAVLLAQGCAEPVARPPAIPHVRAA